MTLKANIDMNCGSESDNNYSEDSEDNVIDEFNKQNNKRKNEENDDENQRKKKKHNSKKDLYKQPTVEELNQLRETENLFHSNLFRIQIEEILDEVKIKPKYTKLINSWFEKFVTNVKSIKDTDEIELQITEQNIKIPFTDLPQNVEGTLKFAQPRNIKIIGSSLTNTMLKPELIVDIMLEIPPTVMKKADCENYVYLKKRAAYLAYVAANLDKDLFVKLSFYGNQMKPVLKIVPSGKLGSKVTMFVHCGVYFTKDKFNKCLPEKCNVKPEWFLDNEIKHEESEDNKLATPYYNSIITHDMTMLSSNEFNAEKIGDFVNIRDGIILLKIWLRQREIGRSYDAFNSHVITSYIMYLLQTKKLNTHMSSYQIVKNVWIALVHNDWTETGFSLCQDEGIEQRIANYKNHFKCVFLDITGYHNIAAHITEDDFNYIKRLANDSLECLKEPDFSSFNTLFLMKVPLYRSFESILCIHKTKACESVVSKNSCNKELLNFGIDKCKLYANYLVNVLKTGYTNRLENLKVFPRKNQEWDLTEKIPEDCKRIYVGLNFDREYCFDIIQKGPDAKSAEAKPFREFWGEKSELRHFKDGTIREAIIWGQGKTLSNKRYISKKILQYLMKQKLGLTIHQYFCFSSEIEKYLLLPKNSAKEISYGTGEEATLSILNTFNELNTILRNLQDLPLTINDAQGMSSAFRYTAVFPPFGTLVRPFESAEKMEGTNYLKLREDEIKSLPDYVVPLEVAIQLASSGKWPDQLEALRNMKTAFNLQIAAGLRDQQKLKAQANRDYIDVFKNGYVFRLYIALRKEIALVKEVIEDGVTKYVDNEESIEIEKKMFHLPKLNSALHGLYCTQPAFGPVCCLAKRWLSAHLIDNSHFPELVVELIMSHIFIKSLPYKAPNLPQVAFLRFLSLCSDNNWQLEPIIVNFNKELSHEEMVEMENSISTSRETLPPLVICTPYDKKSIWTKNSPSAVILTRVSLLAKEALKIIETKLYTEDSVNFDTIFRAPLSEYDCLIHLKDKLNPVLWQSVLHQNKNLLPTLHPYKEEKYHKIPVIDFNPVQLYLKELRECYGEFALFFHDTYGGSTIAVLFKPTATEIKEFKVTTVPGRKLFKQDTLKLNVGALIEGFYTLGQGLVENIEYQSKRIPLD